MKYKIVIDFKQCFALIFMFFMGMFFFILIISPTKIFSNTSGFLSSYVYDTIAYSNSNDNFTMEVAEQCKYFTERDLVNCVTTNVAHYYLFNANNYTNFIKVKTPTEFKLTGGVCRDITVTYAAIFKRLGYTYQYNFLPNHVYLTVFNGEDWDFYCNIDGDDYDCYN